MITNVEVENFRGIKNLRLKESARINIITGENAAGKTALLESLFLCASSSPEIAFRLKSLRGMPLSYHGPARALQPSLWNDLFYLGPTPDERITVRIDGTAPHQRSLEIYYESADLPISVDDIGKEYSTGSIDPVRVAFKWKSNKESQVSHPLLVGDKLQDEPVKAPPFETAFFSANRAYSPEEAVTRFSRIDVAEGRPKSIRHIVNIFPAIENIDVQMTGVSPILHASLRNMNRKIPINLVSAGITKLVTIFLGIEDGKDNIILIDEIENGIHYEILPRVWTAIIEIANATNAQVFATTHSKECIEALVFASDELKADIAHFRLTRRGQETVAHRSSSRVLQSALKLGEVR